MLKDTIAARVAEQVEPRSALDPAAGYRQKIAPAVPQAADAFMTVQHEKTKGTMPAEKSPPPSL
jgi:hypothetical protein